ncbi:hypothetical protein SLS53_004017 [Cytospora paraplurivora]|uniref:Uncharacterized protein n=1 Tax=Cytospora paraplurivora TaxID=2898453 RepID=A0AAN9UHD7_9PEZI
MVSLQNKIIYAPYLPPTARFEEISTWKRSLYGIEWKEIHMRSIDGTDLALAVASVSSEPGEVTPNGISHHVYILYLQGRPNEIGINLDTIAATRWISQLHDNTYARGEDGQHKVKPIFFIWGQSIGAGFATNLAASGAVPAHFEPVALVLETPFLSIKDMLETIYPEKWLPYKYLYPFLRNHLDSYKNLGTIAQQRREKGLRQPQIFILEAGRDEVVPPRHAEELRRRCDELQLPVETKVVPRAFHSDAMIGRKHVAEFLMRQTARVIQG